MRIKRNEADASKEKRKNNKCRTCILSLRTETLDKYEKELSEKKADISKMDKQLKLLNMPLADKYTSDITVLKEYLGVKFHDELYELVPDVVFWEHTEDHILPAEILLNPLLEIKELDKISRPLLNIFRMGIDIKEIDDLHEAIKKIKDKPNYRSSVEGKLNREINKYIKRVWEDYDQKLNIAVEHDRIRIDIFDPSDNHSPMYYNMAERSQGAQTFLSFLFTIGMEAEEGEINNTILLLDEPENHLHPAGVRFFLEELKKIANKGNIVIYATHSMFMIDRNKFDNHLIVKKEKEQTTIEFSEKNRIGSFMQEEVLYSALDKDLESPFASDVKINFVFEGNGDAMIFEKIHSLSFPKSTEVSFHHGGKCSDMEKYFKKKPIQLGTKWVFVLDNDKPASILKSFIEKRYKNYINEDIFIFQYDLKKYKDVTLEDLLDNNFMSEIYFSVIEEHNLKYNKKAINKLISSRKNYNEYDKEICKMICITDSFKGDFKKKLNNQIENKTRNWEAIECVKSDFPECLKWTENVFQKLKEKFDYMKVESKNSPLPKK